MRAEGPILVGVFKVSRRREATPAFVQKLVWLPEHKNNKKNQIHFRRLEIRLPAPVAQKANKWCNEQSDTKKAIKKENGDENSV